MVKTAVGSDIGHTIVRNGENAVEIESRLEISLVGWFGRNISATVLFEESPPIMRIVIHESGICNRFSCISYRYFLSSVLYTEIERL